MKYKSQKYKFSYFNILSSQCYFIKTVVLKNLLIILKNNKYIILGNLLSIIIFIKMLVWKKQQYHIMDT